MNEDILKHMSEIDSDHCHSLWLKAKTNGMEEITGREKQLAEIMLDHEDQYSELFESRGATPSNSGNPFFHIMLHSVLETQLADKEPIEVYQFVLSMSKRGCSHHEAVHLAEAIFVRLLRVVLEENVPFDLERYKFLLRKYKKRNPQKIHDLLEQEFKVAARPGCELRDDVFRVAGF